MVGKVNFEQVEPSINGFAEPKFLSQANHQRDSAMNGCLRFVAQFILQAALGKFRPGSGSRFAILGAVGFFQPSKYWTLAFAELF